MDRTIRNQRSQVISESLLELSKGNESAIRNMVSTDETEEKIIVRITAEDINKIIPELEKFNFEVVASSPENYFVEGTIAASKIPNLRTLTKQGLLGVIPVYKPITAVGSITSQADFVHESDRVRANLPDGFDGTGVTVGIMSDSYDDLGGAVGDVASGDLPSNGVDVLQDLGGGGIDEGRAMAQLVHDLAPGADLAFSSVFFSEADFAQQIRDLADPNIGDADVLVDDIIYFAEPFFQDGIVAQAVDDVVTNDGVTYFSSAGNNGSKAFESDSINFVDDVTLDSVVTYPGTYYDFNISSGVDTTQGITLENGQEIRLAFQWDDPYYTTNGVDTELDLYLLDSEGNLVAEAIDYNTGNQVPFEFLLFRNDSGSTAIYELVIAKDSGPNPGRIKYVNFGSDPLDTEYPNNAPTIYGHSAADNAQAVGAVPWFDQDTPESFTSKGPTTILFEADGTPKADPEIRNTPDISAIDGTNTTFFGNDISTDGDGFANFFGTSAAAPHAAAIAALMKQADPDLAPEEVYTRLQATAEDIYNLGNDDLTGFGLINAFDAIYGTPISANLDFTHDFEDGKLPEMFATNSTGAGRIEVTEEDDPIGSNHLTLQSSADGSGADSLNEVILHVNAADLTNVQLSFDQKEFSDEDHPMSASFIDSENSDGVALSTDGTNWHSLISLTGANSTDTYQNMSFDLSTFADDKGLILGSDVQIKFQQFDDFNINFDGMAFDNIMVTGDVINVPTESDDALLGTDANDTINGLAGNDSIDGLDGDDSLMGSLGNDTLLGGNGLDTLIGSHDSDSLLGGSGEDVINGGKHNDFGFGGSGSDTLRGGHGDDYLIGDSDGDLLLGNSGNDSLSGAAGDDTLKGASGYDTLVGGNGNDLLQDYGGADLLKGNDGNDTLRGGKGEDTLSGGAGTDILFGNAGEDMFILATDLNTEDRDIIHKFSLNEDYLGVSALSELDDLSISSNNNGSIITGAKGQQVAFLSGVRGINLDDLNFVEI